MSDDKINVVGTNIREKATVIWNVANHLKGKAPRGHRRLSDASLGLSVLQHKQV